MNEIKKPYTKATCCSGPDCGLYDPEVCWGEVTCVGEDEGIDGYYDWIHRCEAEEHEY